MRLDHFDHHMVFQILNAMQHPLSQRESSPIMLRVVEVKFLGYLVGPPNVADHSFDVFTVE